MDISRLTYVYGFHLTGDYYSLSLICNYWHYWVHYINLPYSGQASGKLCFDVTTWQQSVESYI